MAAGGRPLRPRLARSLALARLRPGLVVVDIGCGRGEAALYAARRGVAVIALDFSLSALRLARRTLDLPGGNGASAAAATAVRLPIASGSADRVLLLDVLEHLTPPDARAVLGEIRRILAPGGFVVVHTLPNRWALDFTYRAAALALRRLPTDPRSGYEKRVHVFEQSPISLKRLLKASGFGAQVWVEEWTSIHARRGNGADYPDPVRRMAYPVLRGRLGRLLGRLAATPMVALTGNDLFAVAWSGDDPGLRSVVRPPTLARPARVARPPSPVPPALACPPVPARPPTPAVVDPAGRCGLH